MCEPKTKNTNQPTNQPCVFPRVMVMTSLCCFMTSLCDVTSQAFFQSPVVVPNRHVRILPVSWAPNRPIVLTDFVQRPHRRARASSLPPQLDRPTRVHEIDDPEVAKAFSLGLDLSRYKVLKCKSRKQTNSGHKIQFRLRLQALIPVYPLGSRQKKLHIDERVEHNW